MVLPGCLITGIAFIEKEQVMIENKYPHVTLFHSSKIRPVESNTFLEKIKLNHELKKAYFNCILQF